MSRRSAAACAAVALFMVVVCLSFAPVQAGGAGAAGRVLDRRGDPVPGAVVTVADAAGTVLCTTVSDEAGRYATPALPPGAYTFEVALPGIAARARASHGLAEGTRLALDLRLDLDMVHDTALVVAASPEGSLESARIRESFARDAGEALAQVPGVERVRKGAIASDIVLRGFKGENVSVTVDGARVHRACPGKMDPPAFQVDFAEIERIDVRKGPFDVAAPGALGGSVDIVTRRPGAGAHGQAQVAAGSFGYVAPSVVASYGGARGSVSAGYASRVQDVYEDGAGTPFTRTANYVAGAEDARAFDVETLWGSATFLPAPGHRIELQGTRQRVDGALYPYLQMDAEYDDADRARLAYEAAAPFAGVTRLEAAVAYAGVEHWMTDRARTTAANRSRGYSMGTLAETSVVDARLAVTLGRVVAGVDGSRRAWDATNESGGLNGAPYAVQAAIPDVQTDAVGLYASWTRPLGAAWRIEAGARVDRFATDADPGKANTDLYAAYQLTRSTSRTDTEPSGHVLVGWKGSGRWEWFAGVGRSVRVPTAEERYFAQKRMGSDWVGDPELAPARNTEVDVGAGYVTAGVAADVALFHSTVDGFVTLYDQVRQQAVPGVTNTTAKSYANVDATIYGGEASVRVAAGRRLALEAGVAYTYGRQEPDPARGIVTTVLPEIPPLKGRLSARYERERWFGEAALIAAARQDRVNPDLREVETPGWGAVHLRGGFNTRRFSIVAGVDNLFDRHYRESLSYARDPFRSGALVYEPGRSATVSLQLRY